MDNIKDVVKKTYGTIALDVIQESSCCGGSSKNGSTSCMAEEYSAEDLVHTGIANLGLGCGTPAAYAGLEEGMTVLDLGSGAGIDVFIAAKYIGSSGKAIGVDMTEAMINRARQNASELGYANVEFRLGEIEQLPVESNTIDRVISNCVINLVPDKRQAFAEIHRVLKPGGSFVVSDIVTVGELPVAVRNDPQLWAGCVAGAVDRDEYIKIIEDASFLNVQVLSERQFDKHALHLGAIESMTVTATK
jgi:arsenite methyltransferase